MTWGHFFFGFTFFYYFFLNFAIKNHSLSKLGKILFTAFAISFLKIFFQKVQSQFLEFS